MVSQLAPVVKNNDDIRFLSIGSLPAVLSTEVARHFQKKHTNVLRDIDRLRSILPKSFVELNFELMFRVVEAGDRATRKVRIYALTRDAFSLLVMGMTGKAAIVWKLRYIEAFNALEAAALDSRAELAREAAYRQGLDEGRAATLPEVKAAEEKARRETAYLLWTLGPAQKRRLRRAARYRDLGLSQREIGKLMEIPRRSVQELLKAADALGELPERHTRPMQGSLLTLDMQARAGRGGAQA